MENVFKMNCSCHHTPHTTVIYIPLLMFYVIVYLIFLYLAHVLVYLFNVSIKCCYWVFLLIYFLSAIKQINYEEQYIIL